MALSTPVCDFGRPAPDFGLDDVDGRRWTLADVAGRRGTLIIFLCNHCPYVQEIIDRLVAEVGFLQELEIGAAAIMSNDWTAYPEDDPEMMKLFATRHRFSFPYLIDRDQSAARAYGAVCTPDFFGYNAALELNYRGRLDASRKEAVPEGRRDLFEAMRLIAETGQGPLEQVPSMGCSIKWRSGT